MVDANVPEEQGAFSDFGQFLGELHDARDFVFGLFLEIGRLLAQLLDVGFDLVDVGLDNVREFGSNLHDTP